MLLVLFSAPELLFYPALLVAAVILIVKASATFLHVDQVKACSLLVSSAEGNLESSYQFVLKLLIWLTGGQGCISCVTCSYPELTKDHVLTSAYVKIFRTVTRNAVNKSV